MGEWKFVQLIQVTWPRWPPCIYMVKTLKKILLRQKADDLETWSAVLSAQVLPSVFQIMTLVWPWPILRQGQIWSIVLLYGKKVKQWIFQKLLKSMMSKLADSVKSMITWTYMNIKGQGQSLTLVQGHSDSTFSNFFFFRNCLADWSQILNGVSMG